MSFSRNQKLRLGLYGITAITGILVPLYLYSQPADTLLSTRVIVLSLNMTFLFTSVFLLIGVHFAEQKEQLEETNKTIGENFKQIQSLVNLNSTYRKILGVDGNMQGQHYKSLNEYLAYLGRCIDEERSGELTKREYYHVLHSTADAVMQDKLSISTDRYRGYIWAMTFCMDNEWSDDDNFEVVWFRKMKEADSLGVSTTRLWAINEKIRALLKSQLNDESTEFLSRIRMYCKKDTSFRNTKSYAISSSIIDTNDLRELGKGFFATQHNDDTTSLILSVAKEKLRTTSELCGEIEFSEIRRSSMQEKWNFYVERATPLNQYLKSISSPSVIEKMKELNFDLINE